MKLRDLKALLSRLEEVDADPDDQVVFAPDGSYLLVVRTAGGMHQSFGDDLELTDADREFLHSLRIPF